jgi:uncharacterized protein (DUF111 family)
MTDWMIEAHVSGLTPAAWPLLVERLLEAGALEVAHMAAVVGHNQPLTRVSAVTGEAEREAIVHVLIEHASTFEVRSWPIERTTVEHDIVAVTTRWGDVRLVLRIWRGRVLEALADENDCADVARVSGAPYELIAGEARRLGDAYVGQRRS